MKRYKVIYSPHALNDLEDTVRYYNKLQKGLGKRFAGQLQLVLKSIKNNPHFASVRYEDVRCAQVPKFPYLVHYAIEEDTRTLMIAAIYSTHQKPLWE
jgi:plasmid stabilization system protein ParE